jgi:hypothetical protein
VGGLIIREHNWHFKDIIMIRKVRVKLPLLLRKRNNISRGRIQRISLKIIRIKIIKRERKLLQQRELMTLSNNNSIKCVKIYFQNTDKTSNNEERFTKKELKIESKTK